MYPNICAHAGVCVTSCTLHTSQYRHPAAFRRIGTPYWPKHRISFESTFCHTQKGRAVRSAPFSVPSWNIMPGTTYLGHNIISRIGKFRPESWKEASAQRRNSRGRLAKRETPYLVCVSFGVDTMALNPRPSCKYKSRRMISHGWGKRSRPLHVGGFVTPWARRILLTEPGLYPGENAIDVRNYPLVENNKNKLCLEVAVFGTRYLMLGK